MNFLLLLSIYIMLIIKCVAPDTNITSEMYKRDEIVLSRRKRYLIFPEGSSLQLVYCLTVPSVGIGQIFTIGGTAALAWELPHNPYSPFRKPAELLHRRVDKVGASTSGEWKFQDTSTSLNDRYRKTYFKTFTPNNLSSSLYDSTIERNRQSINNSPSYRRYYKWKNDRNNLIYRTINNKNSYKNNYGGRSYVHPDYYSIHRKTRRDLYSKIQKFFTAQSKDGKACLLKAVCEVSNTSLDKVGTFMEEIIKAIFRVKPHENYEDEDEYDTAYNKNHNCTEKYPTCESSVWNIF